MTRYAGLSLFLLTRIQKASAVVESLLWQVVQQPLSKEVVKNQSKPAVEF